MTDTKRPRAGARAPTYGAHRPLGGASTTGPLAGASILSEELQADPTKPIRDAVALLEQTRNSFKSKHVGRARAILEEFLQEVAPALDMPEPEIPETVTVRLDDELGRELATRGEVTSTAVKRDLARYYSVVRDEAAAIRLTVSEALVVVSVASMMDKAVPHRFLAAAVEQYLERDWARFPADPQNAALDEERGRLLVAELRRLSPAAATALVDACERFARIYPRYEQDPGRALRRVGLLGQRRFSYGPAPDTTPRTGDPE